VTRRNNKCIGASAGRINWGWWHAAYLIVADEEVGRQIPFAFLDRVKDDFKRRYQGGKADLTVAHGLDSEFGYGGRRKTNHICLLL
jgi:hypothetical protein